MLERIVVAISQTQSDVDPLIRLLQNMPVHHAVLVHCVESVIPWPSRDQAAMKRAREGLDILVKQAREHTQVPIEPIVRLGIPAQQLIHTARDSGADTIVMGAFVGTPREEFFLGSTTLETIRNSPTHMLILHPPGTDDPIGGGLHEPLMDHVLFSTDFSDYSTDAYEQLVAMTDNGLKRASLLHVQDVTRIEPHLLDRLAEFDATDSERLDKMAQRLSDRGVQVQRHVELGIPEQSIVKMAEQLQVSCIAIGSRGRTPSQLLKWGSVSERVVRAAQPPVLVIKQPAEEQDAG